MKSDKNGIGIRRQRLIIALLCLLLCVGVTVGAVFAFTQLVFRSDEQNIVASNVYFKVNGKTFRDNVESTALSFTRGETRDVDLAVEFISGGSESAVNYAVELQLAGADNELARAVEVYRKTDGGYEFFGMLSGLAGYTARGVAVANQEASAERFRFVYSPAAGDYYENKTFSLSASVTGEVTTSTAVGNVVYINELTALTASANAGKTVRLMKDVTVSEDLTLDAPVLLDLNGKTLTVESGKTLTVNYADGAAGSAYAAYGSLAGIIDSKAGGAVVGALSVRSCGSDLYLLGDGVGLDGAAVTFADGVKDTHVAGFFDAVAYNYKNRVAGKTFVPGDVVPLLANLNRYLDPANVENNAYGGFSLFSESGVLAYDAASRTVKAQATELTNNYSFSVSGTDGANSLAVRGGVKVRGSNAYSVAEAYVAAIADPITSSQFFPTYDRASGLSLTWVTDDSSNGKVFDADGAYLKGGLDSLDDFSDRSVRIALTAGNNDAGDANSDAVGDYYVAAVTRRVVVLDAERRADLLYATGQIILEENTPYAFADYFNSAYFSQSADGNVNKTNLSNISVDLGEEGARYLDVTGDKFATALNVAKVPDKTSVSFEITVTFTFTDTDPRTGVSTDKTYAVNKPVIVLGYTESVTLRNAQATIQSWLDDTEYARTGGVYDLSVLSYLAGTGDFVEYSVPAGVDYVFVKDDVYVQNAGGRFYLADGKYTYFAAYYTTAGASASDHDVVLGSGDAAVYYKITDNKNGAYVIIGGVAYAYGGGENCYDRTAVISVLPEKVPPYDEDVTVTARIFRLDASGGKIYCRTDGTYSANWTDANPRLEYSVSLTVRGILHNRANEIADSAVYSALLVYYDLDGDGYIGLAEAKAEWITVDGKWALSLDGKSAANAARFDSSVIDLAGRSISNLKGLEYFTNAVGYYLSNNSVSDLTYLSGLTKLEALDLSANLITDISALSYLDNLTTLGLSSNNITDISALKYLRKLSTINLASNAVTDFMPLAEHTNIKYLDVQQNTEAEKLPARYAFALIYANNVKNGGFSFYEIYNAPPYTAQNPYNAVRIANATSLRRLNEIGQVYATLHLPTGVDGKSVTWYSSSPYIEVDGAGTAAGAEYYAYTIKTPPVDTAVTLTVHVGAGDGEVSRSISVLLLSDRSEPGSNEVYLEVAEGVFRLMNDVVPDKTLRSLLFSLVDSSDDTPVDVGGGKTVSGLRAVTMAEIAAWAAANNAPEMYWSGRGMTDLTGIEYFAAVFENATLDISANAVSDLTPLASLTKLTSLRLGGMKYDFSQLLGGADGGITGLQRLYVYECYGLADNDVLAMLYKVYITNVNVDIYKDSAEKIWDPYAELMPRYVRTLPSFYAFMDVGDGFALLGGTLDGSGNAYCAFDFYGIKTVTFNVTAGAVYGSDLYTLTNNTIALKTAAARDTAGYVRFTLGGNDGRGTVTYDGYYVELLAEANTRFAVDLGGGTVKPLDEVFTGYTIRANVLARLYADNSLEGTIAAAKAGGGYAVVDVSKFAAMNITSLTVDGTYETDDPLGGLQYLEKVTSLTLARDANLGDGGGLVNITSLTIKFSFINFSSVATPLPKLKTLAISGSNTSPVFYKRNADAAYYELLYGGETYLVPDHDYYLRWFTGLSTLTLNDNNKKISDWTFLFGLLFTDDGSGQKLNVTAGATDGLTYNGQSVRHNLSVLNAYNNANTYVVTTARAGADVDALALGTLNGSISGTFSVIGVGEKTFTDAVGFGIVAALFRASDAAAPGYYLLNNTTKFSMTDFTYSFAVDPAAEYAEFNAAITETGAKADGLLLSQDEDQTVSSGATLSLPLTTFGYTGTDFGDDNYFSRAFGIRWSLYGYGADLTATVTGGSMTESAHSLGFKTFTYDFAAAPSKAAYKTAALDITLSSTHDYYVLVVGTIGEYYYDNNAGVWRTFATVQTLYTYVYPLLIKTGTTAAESFANIPDTALRFALFLSCADSKYMGTLEAYSASFTSLSLNYSQSSLNIPGNRSSSIVFKNLRTTNTAVTNLTGINVLQGLKSVSFTGFPLSKIDALGLLINLESLKMNVSGVDYLPDLSKTAVTEVSITASNINDLSAWKKCESLITLTLTTNDITANMLKYLYDPVTGVNNIPNVKTLDLRYNQCSYDYAMIEWMYLLTGKGGAVSSATALTTLNGWTVNASDIASLRAGYRGIEYSAGNKILAYPEYTTGAWTDYCTALNNTTNSYVHTDAFQNETISAGQFSVAFANSTVRTRVNGSIIRTLKLTVKIYPSGSDVPSCWLSSAAPIYTAIDFTNTNRSEIQLKGRNASTAYDVANFDAGLVAYLLGNASNYTVSGNVYTLKSDTLQIKDNYGIGSLRGINYLGFKTINIENNPLITSLWSGNYLELTSFRLAGCRLFTDAVACFADAPNCVTVNLRDVRGIDYSQINSLKNVKSLTVGGTGMWRGADSVRQAYIKLLNGTYTIGGASIGNLTSFSVDLTNKNANLGTAWSVTKMYSDALTYFYAQSFDNFANVGKIQGTGLYNSGDMFFTLANKDFGSIFAMMGGDSRTTVTSGTTVTRYKLPVGETVSYNDLSNPMVFRLPAAFYYGGGAFLVTWSVLNGETDVTGSFMTGNTFTLSAANVDKLGVAASSCALTFRAVMTNGAKTLTKDGVITVSDVTSTSSSTTDAVDYEYYVEISGDGACLPADRVFASGRFTEWIFGGVSGIGGTKYNNNGIRTAMGGDNVIFNTTTTTHGVAVDMRKGWGIMATAATDGHVFTYASAALGDNAVVLTYDFAQRLYALDTTNNESVGNSMGITSLKGIEVFANLKEVYFVAGNFTDLSPLSGLHLSLFSYQNANGADAAASYISDFTPLVKGSAGTLEVFVYDSFAASVQPTDMTFLLAFDKLKEAYLFGSSPYSGYSVPNNSFGDFVQYLETPSFSYLVSALAKTSATLYIGAIAGNNANNIHNAVAAGSWANHYSYDNIKPVYAAKGLKKTNYYAVKLRPKDSVAAIDALASFDSRVSPYYAVGSGYRLTIKGGTASAADGMLTVKAKLPAMLVAGYLYAIDWRTGSTHLAVDGYGITGSLTVGGVTYDGSNAFASYDEFKTFLTENEAAVYNAVNSGAFDVCVNVTLTLPGGANAAGGYASGLYQSALPLIMRSEINEAAYERLLSVDIAATLAAAAN